MRLAVVLTTRHRSDQAIAAIRSILTQKDERFIVVVSDNSSQAEHVSALSDFCAQSGDPRLLYIRPPESLAMPTHWDWALQQTLARTDATHLQIHYDRKMWKSDSMRLLAEACAFDPHAVVTHACDFTAALENRFAAWSYPGTGRLYEIETQRVVTTIAGGTLHNLGQPIPLLSNCMVPRAILERVRDRFGSICDSVSPDITFTFRFSALFDRYIHFDRALTALYAFRLSNGQAYYRRDTTGTFGDFMSLWGDRPWLDAAPIPGLTLGINVAFHEYNLVRREIGGERFPEIEFLGYVRELGKGLAYIEDPALRAELQGVLEGYGWTPPPPEDVLRRPLWCRVVGRIVRTLRPSRANFADLTTHYFDDEAAALGFLLERTLVLPQNPLLDILEAREVAAVS